MDIGRENSVIVNNQFVWAKIRFCPYWPARVVSPPRELGKAPKHKLCVLFFRSKNYGFVTRENVVDYSKNKSRYLKKCRKKEFLNAVTEMEEILIDPDVFASNGRDRQNDDEIVVKKESNPIIKSEEAFNEMPYQTEVVPRFGSKTYIANLKMEKNKVIQELLDAKNKNQQLILQQQQNQKQILNANRLVAQSAVTIQNLTAEIQDLKQQLQIAKLNSTEKSSSITGLKQDKRLLAAQVKQLQMNKCYAAKSSDKRQSKENTSSSEGEFEVDSIQSHKIKGKQHEFYVRWKGYSQEHDCWVKEKNLNCPIILKAYLREHNLK